MVLANTINAKQRAESETIDERVENLRNKNAVWILPLSLLLVLSLHVILSCPSVTKCERSPIQVKVDELNYV